MSVNSHMQRKFLSAKIHRARVTHADLNYEGSITLSPELLRAANMRPYEAVHVWNVTQGTRFETYIIVGEPNTADISVNGAAAHLVAINDIIIIATFVQLTDAEAQSHVPIAVFVDEQNQVKSIREEVPGPKLVG